MDIVFKVIVIFIVSQECIEQHILVTHSW